MVPEARDQKEAEKLHQSGAGVRPQVASEDESSAGGSVSNVAGSARPTSGTKAAQKWRRRAPVEEVSNRQKCRRQRHKRRQSSGEKSGTQAAHKWRMQARARTWGQRLAEVPAVLQQTAPVAKHHNCQKKRCTKVARARARRCDQRPPEVRAAATEMAPRARTNKVAQELQKGGAGARPPMKSTAGRSEVPAATTKLAPEVLHHKTFWNVNESHHHSCPSP